MHAPRAPADHPWIGLGLPPWVEADHANLEALARRGNADAIDAGRAWNTSQWLVRIGREIGQRRLATAGRRGAAFGIDLAVTLPLAVVVWVVAALVAGGGFSEVANSVAFNAAAIGYPAYAFVYLTVAEATTGTTLGKWVVGIEVTGREERRAGPLSVLIRNVPKLIPLELVGVGGALITAILIGASAPAAPGDFEPRARRSGPRDRPRGPGAALPLRGVGRDPGQPGAPADRGLPGGDVGAPAAPRPPPG